MPENTQKVGRGENDDDQSDYLVRLEVHEGFANRITVTLDALAHIMLQLLVVVIVYQLSDSFHIQQLEQSRYS